MSDRQFMYRVMPLQRATMDIIQFNTNYPDQDGLGFPNVCYAPCGTESEQKDQTFIRHRLFYNQFGGIFFINCASKNDMLRLKPYLIPGNPDRINWDTLRQNYSGIEFEKAKSAPEFIQKLCRSDDCGFFWAFQNKEVRFAIDNSDEKEPAGKAQLKKESGAKSTLHIDFRKNLIEFIRNFMLMKPIDDKASNRTDDYEFSIDWDCIKSQYDRVTFTNLNCLGANAAELAILDECGTEDRTIDL